MACHRQGRADPGGLHQVEHPLSQTLGGHEKLGTEDGGGPAWDGLQMRKGCPSNPDLPDGLHPGGGLSGAGWALGGITAATRGWQYSPWSSAPALLLIMQEKVDEHRKYVQLWLHGVVVVP
ncbi:hypothetical protein NDU88_004855 [Pleurodeles waltl]|uniref:Uncharacterized protein n=1 Tax=Pleurodeles waltl TaxID=8319 RepID=A0AAV7M8B0_PLEWA|nr:hypothetical protein NDU88_004855 [Pleurodeles waltl]